MGQGEHLRRKSSIGGNSSTVSNNANDRTIGTLNYGVSAREQLLNNSQSQSALNSARKSVSFSKSVRVREYPHGSLDRSNRSITPRRKLGFGPSENQNAGRYQQA